MFSPEDYRQNEAEHETRLAKLIREADEEAVILMRIAMVAGDQPRFRYFCKIVDALVVARENLDLIRPA